MLLCLKSPFSVHKRDINLVESLRCLHLQNSPESFVYYLKVRMVSIKYDLLVSAGFRLPQFIVTYDK